MNISKIVDLYKRHRMTQEELADNINMSKTNLSNIILGKQEAKVSTIEAIAQYFKVPVGYFFDEAEAPMGGHVQNANGKNIIQSIGEMQCRKELSAAQMNILELQHQVELLQMQIKSFKIEVEGKDKIIKLLERGR
ncbi:MAG: helix-turn-helix domain-containing protein [Lentimicrobiaceae bacterium]|jgi:transcriptional regulator with XRE-family HTH domain|nr:helix-turn-helix domain-containing protein [Lentimicrobiaceae bacterium]